MLKKFLLQIFIQLQNTVDLPVNQTHLKLANQLRDTLVDFFGWHSLGLGLISLT